jgi:hypothetical protein
MSFQTVINNASEISVERKAVVASTTARDGTYRAVSRGGQVWSFTVRLPDGARWQDYRQTISKLEKLDRFTSDTISFNNTGHAWLFGYQGNSVNYTGFAATWTQGATSITLTSSPTTSSGYKFRAGDILQLGTGKVYTVAADVAYNSNTVTLHRPIIDSTGSGTLKVADDCDFTIKCTSFPTWTVFARDQVSWSGPFVFVEAL